MSRIISARDHLERANGLAAVLAAAYDVFEGMRLAFRTCEDPATGLFAAFVMASASAADGRDAVAFAPSLPLRRVHEKPGAGEEPHEGLQQGGHCWLAADVSQVLADRLFQAAGSAPDPGDRTACDHAARCARRICELLGGAGP